ncbi:MAG: hypothetical protein FGM32_03835 [Candidatus Kapabacteria bacterium]|nr:hypothetical protein [Candidatus Kapabacteria bacterium]
MPRTLYLHPKRTLLATWSLDGERPCLTDYCELEPSASLQELEPIDAVVVAADSWFVHGYPTSSNDEQGARLEFELEQICGLHGDRAPVVDVECRIATSQDSQWTSIVCVDAQSVQAIRSIFGQHCRVVSDVRADIDVALASTPAQPHTWMIHGRRGDRLITAVIGENHEPLFVGVQPASSDLTIEASVLGELALLRQRFALAVSHVLLFGDHLTAAMADAAKTTLKQAGVKAARFQPFRLVTSTLDAATSGRIIARAHVVAPIMANVLVETPF